MKNFIKWFAGFFEDQKGSASSKRAVLYMLCFFLYMIVNGSMDGKVVDQQVLFSVVGLIAFLVGAVVTEFVAGASKLKSGDGTQPTNPVEPRPK